MKTDPRMNISTPSGMALAIQWLRGNIDRIADGGSWLVPRSGSIIQINHSTKTATVVCALLPEPDTRRVFEAMGWNYHDTVFGQAELATLN